MCRVFWVVLYLGWIRALAEDIEIRGKTGAPLPRTRYPDLRQYASTHKNLKSSVGDPDPKVFAGSGSVIRNLGNGFCLIWLQHLKGLTQKLIFYNKNNEISLLYF